MINHFIFGYSGNKRTEVKHIATALEALGDPLNNSRITTIIEPYCGSSAMSFYIWRLYGDRFNYILNDGDKRLMDIYETLQDEKKTVEFEEKINSIVATIREAPPATRKAIYNGLKDDTAEGYYIKSKYYNIRRGLFPVNSKWANTKIKAPIVNFLRSGLVELRYGDGLELIKEGEQNAGLLFLLDPPYLLTCNAEYKSGSLGTFEVYKYLSERMGREEGGALIYGVFENSWFMKILYEKFEGFEYGKTYTGITKKTTIHRVIKF